MSQSSARTSAWIEVKSKDSDLKSGWIHATLLSKDTTAEQLINSNATISSDPLFDLFMQAFNQYQSKLKTNTGHTYFAKVENPGNRVIQLTITDDWLNVSRPERDVQLTEIFNIWNAAVGDDVPITVDIIDRDGTRLLSKFK
ncbi:MAG: SH3b protein [Gammaproteobacteria bacterium]|nr:SH3b protein [Gammaproteobacteria bacterium]